MKDENTLFLIALLESKLPSWFSIVETDKYNNKDRYKATQSLDPSFRKVQSEQVSPRSKVQANTNSKISEFKLKLLLQKFSKYDWENSGRFAPII